MKTYDIGLALAGGGTRGIAHLGAIKAIEDRGLRPQIISGTSVGSLIAVLYADGYSVKDMLRLANALSLRKIVESSIPKGGFFKPSGIGTLLHKALRAKRFEELKTPVRVVATDIEKGVMTVFEKGPIIPAVMASCSVPLVFMPMKIGGRYYVDGAITKNFPASIIREECEHLIGVNITPSLHSQYESSMKYVAERMINLLIGTNTMLDRRACDCLIEPKEIMQYSMFDFTPLKELFTLGYKETIAALDAGNFTPNSTLLSLRKR